MMARLFLQQKQQKNKSPCYPINPPAYSHCTTQDAPRKGDLPRKTREGKTEWLGNGRAAGEENEKKSLRLTKKVSDLPNWRDAAIILQSVGKCPRLDAIKGIFCHHNALGCAKGEESEGKKKFVQWRQFRMVEFWSASPPLTVTPTLSIPSHTEALILGGWQFLGRV